MASTTETITDTAMNFFEAVDAGKGWEECSKYCHPDAGFTAQAAALAEITTVEAYSEWMKGLLTFVTDTSYEIKGLGTDAQRNNIVVSAVFRGTHTGEGGPLPPTGKSTSTDYAYTIDFDGDRISHVTKIWNSQYAVEELGWA